MVWQSIVNGAKGIGYFPHRWEPYKPAEISEELQAEMKRTNRQLTELAPVILSPDAPKQVECEAVDGGSVDVLTKEYQGKLYLFAVNNGLEPARARFMLPSEIKATEACVYEEQQKVMVQDGIFEDALGKLGARIYIVHPDARL
jgi:hypothetical protein